MKRIAIIAAAVLMAACSHSNNGRVLTKSGLDPQAFVAEYNGQPTALYTLANESGMEVCITNFGGRIVSIMVPDAKGKYRDVVLGFDNIQDYFPENNKTDFGAAIGRYANRINQGKIKIDGVEYQLPQNNNGHCLHGGPDGWQYKVYETVEADSSHVIFKLVSPDGDANFPGEVTATVTYTLTAENKLAIDYAARTDKTTVINMTNHSYFNLSGDPANHKITEDFLWINSSSYTPADNTLMTTGEIADLSTNPALDFRMAKLIGQDIDQKDNEQIVNGGGYDHNWVLDKSGRMGSTAATLFCPESGIQMNVWTSEPGIQVYSGNFLDGTVTGKNGVVYQKRAAICLESQKYPDTPNKPDWPSATLKPGQIYKSVTVYGFSVVKD
ncbi:MAG: galactose mutarotase [Bacteroidales bacterium]|nr:galactose mutarotase [Candidatus Cryptobacteroides onthequi]